MSRLRTHLRDDEGSVLLTGIGFVVVCLLAIAVVVDASAAYLQRRSLMSLADGAALAGAQSIDLAHYYANGASTGTRLVPASVSAAARRHLAPAVRDHAVTVDEVSSDSVNVRVRVSAPLELPFFGSVRHDVVRVQSSARLDYRPAPQ